MAYDLWGTGLLIDCLGFNGLITSVVGGHLPRQGENQL